jgi:DNA-binding NarL/FixJ family response regulator
MSLIAESKPPVLPASPAVLIVEDEPALAELIREALGRDLNCRVRVADSIKRARRIMATDSVDLMIADIGLPDGDGMSLLQALRAHHPLAESIVITGSPSVEKAIAAMRFGAADLLPKPFSLDNFVDRARRALYRQNLASKNEARIESLRAAVKRLNEARRVVCKKVDLLCNDLVGAYGELAEQLDQVRVQEGFRTLLASAKDLEQLLCHAMDWMLRRIGYCNIAIWLAGHEQFQLGAYMKHSIPGDAKLMEAIRRGLLVKVVKENFIHASGEESPRVLSSAESALLPDQSILATHCTYLGESLAAMVLFREGNNPFKPEDAEIIQAISPIFAVALAAAVRVEGNDENPEDIDDASGNATDGGLDDAENQPKKRKKGDADWWKHGEEPPF